MKNTVPPFGGGTVFRTIVEAVERFKESFNSAAKFAAEGRFCGLAAFFIGGESTQSVLSVRFAYLLAHQVKRRKFAPFHLR